MFIIFEELPKGTLEYCPSNWLLKSKSGSEALYWPRKQQTILQRQPDSKPVLDGSAEETWFNIAAIIKRRKLATKEAAEEEIQRMVEKSETESELDCQQTSVISRPKAPLTKAAVKEVVRKYTTEILTSTPPNSAFKNSMLKLSANPSASPQTPSRYAKQLEDSMNLSPATGLNSKSMLNNDVFIGSLQGISPLMNQSHTVS